jgi:Cyclophilin type peptidyl-prolyl cis-trans isomerase/CLD
MTEFRVYGSTGDSDTFFCQSIVERIRQTNPSEITIISEIYLELDYFKKLKEIRPLYGDRMYGHTNTNCVIRNGELVGSLMEIIKIAVSEYGIEDAEIANVLIFEKIVKEETAKILAKSGHPVAYLQFSRAEKIGDEDEPKVYGKVILELLDDICPLSCENFMKLCTGEKGDRIVNETTGVTAPMHYVNCPVHRIVPGGWVQCGDIVDGRYSSCIYYVSLLELHTTSSPD